MPGKVNLKIYQGATFRHVLSWLNEDETPIDLTGMSALMHVRENYTSPTPLLILSSNILDLPSGSITLGGTSGTIELYLPSAITENIDWIAALYDLELTDSLGDVHRVVEGKITVSKEITK